MEKKIEVTATDFLSKKDGELAKIMEKLLNSEYEEMGGFIEALSGTRAFIDSVYGIKTPDSIWNPIMESVVKMRMDIIKRLTKI